MKNNVDNYLNEFKKKDEKDEKEKLRITKKLGEMKILSRQIYKKILQNYGSCKRKSIYVFLFGI